MNYGKINKVDIANGPGVRVSLFVSGCNHKCKGCFNPETWNFNYGQRFTLNTIDDIYDAMIEDHISGLTVLGGEPLDVRNVKIVTQLCRIIKSQTSGKSIWIYTGYRYEDVKHLEIMRYIDVLVDGPFIEDLKDISLKFRGSSNQRIIDIQKSRELDRIVLWEE